MCPHPGGATIYATDVRSARSMLALYLLLAHCGRSRRAEVRSEPALSLHPSPGRGERTTVFVQPELETSGRVAVEPARAWPVHESVEAPAEVVPSPGGVAEVSTTVLARIEAWHVAPGERVRAGAPLVTLDAPRVAELRTELARARVERSDLAARVNEEERMLPEGATSMRALREARTGLARAEQTIESTLRELAVARAPERGPAGIFTLRAPIAGTLTRREGAKGGVVQPGTLLATVVDMNDLRVAAHVPEGALDLPVGARALVTLQGAFGALPAHVERRAPDLLPDTRRRTLYLVPDAPAELLPRQTGTARIERPRAPARAAVAVPASAVYREGATMLVFVRKGPGRYEPRFVTLGQEGAGLVEVVAGLHAGELVVVRGLFLVASEYLRTRTAG